MAKLIQLVVGIAMSLTRGTHSSSSISVETSVVTITLENKCDETVWPGVVSNAAGIPPLHPTGFSLQKGESKVLHAPPSWGGKIWGRTNCSKDSNSTFKCVTGDCGSGKIECAGAGATPPATLVQFTINDGDVRTVFFDVSLVRGYNLPIWVSPRVKGKCMSAGCRVELNGMCPSKLKVMNSDGEVVACKSACEAFGEEEYCAKPSSYSKLFKTACPNARSYDGDQNTIVTCTGSDYQVTFCPTFTTSTSKKSKGESETPTPHFNVDNGKNTTGNTNIGKIIGVVAGIIFAAMAAGAMFKCYTGDINILNGSCIWY